MNGDTNNKWNQQKLNLAKRTLIINIFMIMKYIYDYEML